MGDVGIKFTLTADERDALRAAQATEQQFAKMANSTRGYANELKAIRGLFGELSKAVNFQGSRSSGQISSDIIRKLGPSDGGRISAMDRTRAAAAQEANQIRAAADVRIRAIRESEERVRQAMAEEERFTAALPANQRDARRVTRQLNQFIQRNDLGDVNDPVVRNVARSLSRQQRQGARGVVLSLREAGGNLELLQHAQQQGVDVGRPLAVRQFVADREQAIGAKTATEAALKDPGVAQWAKFHGLGDISNPEDAKAARSLKAETLAAARREAQAAERAAAAQEAMAQAAEEAAQNRSAYAASSKGVFEGALANAAKSAKSPEVLAAANFKGINPFAPDADQQYKAFRNGDFLRFRKAQRDAAREGRAKAVASTDWAKNVDALSESLAPTPPGPVRPGSYAAFLEAQRAAGGSPHAGPTPQLLERFRSLNPMSAADRAARPALILPPERQGYRHEFSQAEIDAAAREEAMRIGEEYANRVQRQARADRFAGQLGDARQEMEELADARRRSPVRRGLSAVAGAGRSLVGGLGNVAAAADAGIYMLNSAAGVENEDRATQFDALKNIELTYRPLNGMAGNESPDAQRRNREYVRQKAVQYGLSTQEVASSYYDILSASGNMSQPDQRRLMEATMRLKTLAGGDTGMLSKGLISFNNIYGKQTGGIERSAALFKKAADFGGFTTTTLAQLGPDALEYFEAYGGTPEDALATLAVGSLKAGRPENFFTGQKYVRSQMDVAERLGWVAHDDPWATKLKKIGRHSNEDITKVFGREGFTGVHIVSDSADEIAALSADMKSNVRGDDLQKAQMGVQRDPLNAASRLAQSVDAASQQSIEEMIDSGGPGGMKLAADAIKTKLAMTGQEMFDPTFKGWMDSTRQLNLKQNQKMYVDMAAPQVEAKLAAGGEAQREQLQAFRLITGRVQVRDMAPAPQKWTGKDARLSLIGLGKHGDATWGEFFDHMMQRQGDPNATVMRDAGGKELELFEQLSQNDKYRGIFATEVADVQGFKNVGDLAGANNRLRQVEQRIAKSRAAKVTDQASTVGGGASATGDGSQFDYQSQWRAMSTETPADVRKRVADERAANRKTIDDALAGADKDYKKFHDAGDDYSADAAMKYRKGIIARRKMLSTDGDGFTATDERTLANEIREIKSTKENDPLDEATNKAAAKLDKFAEKVNGLAELLDRKFGQQAQLDMDFVNGQAGGDFGPNVPGRSTNTQSPIPAPVTQKPTAGRVGYVPGR